jgi:hypothetical protein
MRTHYRQTLISQFFPVKAVSARKQPNTNDTPTIRQPYTFAYFGYKEALRKDFADLALVGGNSGENWLWF